MNYLEKAVKLAKEYQEAEKKKREEIKAREQKARSDAQGFKEKVLGYLKPFEGKVVGNRIMYVNVADCKVVLGSENSPTALLETRFKIAYNPDDLSVPAYAVIEGTFKSPTQNITPISLTAKTPEEFMDKFVDNIRIYLTVT